MKNILLLVVTVFSMSQVQATSLRNVRLSLSDKALDEKNTGMPLSNIFVYADGAVEKVVCLNKLETPCTRKTVRRLDSYQIDQIDRLIESARDGKIVTIPQHALCFVAPSKDTEATADNGQVFLNSGNICMTSRVNTSPAAKKLLQMLVDFRAEALKQNEIE